MVAELSYVQAQFEFPFGVVSTVAQGSCGMKDWHAWRLPSGDPETVRAAHSRMSHLLLSHLQARPGVCRVFKSHGVPVLIDKHIVSAGTQSSDAALKHWALCKSLQEAPCADTAPLDVDAIVAINRAWYAAAGGKQRSNSSSAAKHFNHAKDEIIAGRVRCHILSAVALNGCGCKDDVITHEPHAFPAVCGYMRRGAQQRPLCASPLHAVGPQLGQVRASTCIYTAYPVLTACTATNLIIYLPQPTCHVHCGIGSVDASSW